MRPRKSLNLRWSRVLTASFLCLAGVGLAGFGLGMWAGDDSHEVRLLQKRVRTLKAQVAESERQQASGFPVGFMIPDASLAGFEAPVFVNEIDVPTTFLGVAGNTVEATGVEITNVVDDTAAERAGLEEGDLLIALDGESVTSFNGLKTTIQSRPVGQTVDLTVQRDGTEVHLAATLGSR